MFKKWLSYFSNKVFETIIGIIVTSSITWLGYYLLKDILNMSKLIIFFILWVVFLITFVVTVISLKIKIAYCIHKESNKSKKKAEFVETWVDIEFTPKRINLINSRNISSIKALGSYTVFLSDIKKDDKEIMYEILLILKQPIDFLNYHFDIVKLHGDIEEPYLNFVYSVTTDRYDEGCMAVIVKMGNIDINNSKYKIQFLSK